MPGTRAFPDAVTVVDDSEQYALGTEWHMSTEEVESLAITGVVGPCVWRYIYNEPTAATAFAAGNVVSTLAGGTSPYNGVKSPLGSAPHRVIGVAQWAVASGKYAWILKDGVGEVLADTGGITASTPLVPGDAVTGAADDAAAITDAAFGVSLEAATATNTAQSRVRCI